MAIQHYNKPPPCCIPGQLRNTPGPSAGGQGQRRQQESPPCSSPTWFCNPAIRGHSAVGKQEYAFWGPLCWIKCRAIPFAYRWLRAPTPPKPQQAPPGRQTLHQRASVTKPPLKTKRKNPALDSIYNWLAALLHTETHSPCFLFKQCPSEVRLASKRLFCPPASCHSRHPAAQTDRLLANPLQPPRSTPQRFKENLYKQRQESRAPTKAAIPLKSEPQALHRTRVADRQGSDTVIVQQTLDLISNLARPRLS